MSHSRLQCNLHHTQGDCEAWYDTRASEAALLALDNRRVMMLVWAKKPMAVKFRSQHKHRKPRRQAPKMMPPQRACRRSKTKELGWECRGHVGSMSSTRVRMHNLPKTSKYIRSLVYNKIRPTEPHRPTLHQLSPSPSMVRPVAPPTHGAATS